MPEAQPVFRVLLNHFFRRFFDNDTLQSEGETLTTVIRALSIVAVPGLMVAFFLQTSYTRLPGRPLWGSIQDQYFFVLFAFFVMGAVTIFEWEMLFPDRLDFLILSPLSIKPRQMLAAKATALIAFLLLFLAGSSLFGTIMLPAVSRLHFWRQLLAHAVAVSLAGTFAALGFLALGGLMLCVLDAARFRLASPILQMLAIAVLVLLLLQYLEYGDDLQLLLTNHTPVARWIPPFWFLGVYEQILHGPAAPPFAFEFTRYALTATAIAAAIMVLTYPLAWARVRRMAIEGISAKRTSPPRWSSAIVQRLVPSPRQRAVFHFISQTLVRNNHYQVYLAIYCGAGLALAIAFTVDLPLTAGPMHASFSQDGLHALLPLSLFWVVAGLRTAFAFPINLSARWLFRISGTAVSVCAAAARRWVVCCAVAVTAVLFLALLLAGWTPTQLLVQLVFGVCLSILLVDLLFFADRVPFNQPRLPGKTSLPLLLTLYVGVLPTFLYSVLHLELRLEQHLPQLALLALGTLAIHAGIVLLRRGPEEIEEEMEGYDGEFQLLGLSRQ
jgi:hypothetical protein